MPTQDSAMISGLTAARIIKGPPIPKDWLNCEVVQHKFAT